MKKIIISLLVLLPINLTAQWEIINEGANGYINDIDFFNENIGWIECDWEVFYTTDGGDSWNSIYYNNNEDEWIRDAVFVSDKIGWIINNGNLIKTIDGGISWEFQLSEVYSLQVLNDSVIFVYGNYIRSSNDGGNNWQIISVFDSFTDENYIGDYFFVDRDYGFVVQNDNDSQRSVISRTTNGGVNWDTSLSGSDYFGDLFFLNDSIGYLKEYGRYEYHNALLYTTIDSGKNLEKDL